MTNDNRLDWVKKDVLLITQVLPGTVRGKLEQSFVWIISFDIVYLHRCGITVC